MYFSSCRLASLEHFCTWHLSKMNLATQSFRGLVRRLQITASAGNCACPIRVSMIVAAYFLDQTANNRVDEVAAIADDLEVKKADDEAAYLTTNATAK